MGLWNTIEFSHVALALSLAAEHGLAPGLGLSTLTRWRRKYHEADLLSGPHDDVEKELARCEYIDRRDNIIALGNSGTGKTHIALGLGLVVCQKGLTVGFITAAALAHELMEARDEKRLLRFQKQLAKYKLLIIDELGFVPLSKTGAELLFEVFSQRYERGSILLTSNLPFDEYEPKPKTAEIPKNLTTKASVDPVGPQAPPTLLRSAYPSHKFNITVRKVKRCADRFGAENSCVSVG